MEFLQTLRSFRAQFQNPSPKRMVIGSNVYLIGNNTCFERKEQLCLKRFNRKIEQRGEVVHFRYNNRFKVRNKILFVSASFYTTFGPVGDRVHVKASYDGVSIGDYGLLKSTIGFGTRGQWPEIINKDWQLKIKLDLQQDDKGYMHFYVEHFERISFLSFIAKTKLSMLAETV